MKQAWMQTAENSGNDKSFDVDYSDCLEAMREFHHKLDRLMARHLHHHWGWVAPEKFAGENLLYEILQAFKNEKAALARGSHNNGGNCESTKV